jgi:hypothetical protein
MTLKLSHLIRDMTVTLPETRSVLPSGSRDQTRVARARLAELALKMHARAQDRRRPDAGNSGRFAPDDGASRDNFR